MTIRALALGSNYPGTDFQLSGCENDATNWATLFESRGATVVEGLVGAGMTRQRMLDLLTAHVAELKRGDRFWFSYSGHGTQVRDRDGDEADGLDEAIVPIDLRTAGPVTDDDLYRVLSPAPQGAQVVGFYDCCFSGTVERFAPPLTNVVPPIIQAPPGRLTPDEAQSILAQYSAAAADGRPVLVEHGFQVVPAVPARRVKFLPASAWVDSDAELGRMRKVVEATVPAARAAKAAGRRARRGALSFSACSDTEVTYDAFMDGLPCGIFTWVALNTWKQVAAGDVRYSDWEAKIRTRLPSEDYPRLHPQLGGTTTQKHWKALA